MRTKFEKQIVEILLFRKSWIITFLHSIDFMPLVSFDTPWKYQKTSGFRMFSGGIERDQCHEVG